MHILVETASPVPSPPRKGSYRQNPETTGHQPPGAALGHSSAIAAGRLGPVSRSSNECTEHGWGHRSIRSRTTWRHTSRPVARIGAPKLWAYTSSRGTVLDST